jgi:aspartyl-tRNA(Asn)/glutamyl-tRNA(Gln) amidotransferase subunit A
LLPASSPFAIGSDGGGSIRIPSAHCGLFGMKASMGRVPLYPGCRDERYPGVSSWESIEHVGPMSRTVADSALILSVITGPDPRDRYSIPAGDVDYLKAPKEGIKGLRIAYSEDWGYAPVDPEVRRVVSEAVKVFETDLGCTVERVHPGWEDPFPQFWTLVAGDSDLVGMRRIMKGREGEMSPHLVGLLNHPWTAEDFTSAKMMRQRVCNHMWRFMQNYDLLLTPTLATPPFPLYMQGPEVIEGKMVNSGAWLCFTFICNLTGQPAASIPAGFTTDGLPVGLHIIGRHLADQTVLAASGAFEKARPWAHVWPQLVTDLGL